MKWQLNQLQQKRIIWGKNAVETKKKKRGKRIKWERYEESYTKFIWQIG